MISKIASRSASAHVVIISWLIPILDPAILARLGLNRAPYSTYRAHLCFASLRWWLLQDVCYFGSVQAATFRSARMWRRVSIHRANLVECTRDRGFQPAILSLDFAFSSWLRARILPCTGKAVRRAVQAHTASGPSKLCVECSTNLDIDETFCLILSHRPFDTLRCSRNSRWPTRAAADLMRR